MGKSWLLVFSFLLSTESQGGVFVQRGMYSEFSLVQGVGKTREAASKDARAAIPADYMTLPNFTSPGNDCTSSDKDAVIQDKDGNYICNPKIAGNLDVHTIPVFPKDAKRQKQYFADFQRKYSDSYTVSAVGSSLKDAEERLKKVIPANGYVLSHSYECMAPNPDGSCGARADGNTHEVRAYLGVCGKFKN